MLLVRMAAIADEATGRAILEILEAETGDQQRYWLVQDMTGSARIHDRPDEILTKIMRLKQGFLEARFEYYLRHQAGFILIKRAISKIRFVI